MSIKQCFLELKHKMSKAKKKQEFESPVRITKRVRIGRNVSIGRFTYIVSGRIYDDVKIGRFCSIAENVVIGGGNHPSNWLSTSTFCYSDMFKIKNNFIPFTDNVITIIGNDVWIGAGTFIRKGITVGNGSIIGAGSVVVKDVPPYAIVAGNPANIIRHRFDEDTIERLLESKWWELNIDKLKKLPYDSIEECLKEIAVLKK